MTEILPIIQIILSIILIILILLQHSDASLGSAFGGSSSSVGHRTRRGSEKIIFQSTIVVAILFALSAITGFFL